MLSCTNLCMCSDQCENDADSQVAVLSDNSDEDDFET